MARRTLSKPAHLTDTAVLNGNCQLGLTVPKQFERKPAIERSSAMFRVDFLDYFSNHDIGLRSNMQLFKSLVKGSQLRLTKDSPGTG
jgi:hypothetical protein